MLVCNEGTRRLHPEFSRRARSACARSRPRGALPALERGPRGGAGASEMGLTIMDPTDESVAIERSLAPRSPLSHATIGLIDIRKARGDIFLDRLEVRLNEAYVRRAPSLRGRLFPAD